MFMQKTSHFFFALQKKSYICGEQSHIVRHIVKQDRTMSHLLHLFDFCPKCGAKTFREDTVKSKRCEACNFVYFMNPSAATVAIIVDEMDQLLVVRRSKEPAKGTLDLPGGFSDCFETAEEGIRREVLEETGLSVTESEYLFSLPNMYRYSGLDIPTLDLFFLCKVADTRGATAMDDVGEVLWLPWQEVKAEDFGLKSISRGVSRLIAMHASGLIAASHKPH